MYGKMEIKVCSLIVIFLVFGSVLGQSSNSLDFDSIQKQIKDSGGPALEDIEKKLQESGVNLSLPDLNSTKVDLNKVENVLKDKCAKQGAEGAVDSLKDQQEQIKECVTSLVDVSQIQDELEEAKKTGSMDEVFAKYCQKWPSVYSCLENATVTVRTCMTAAEQKAFNKSLDILQELQQFMCFKDGDRLAMFVAEGGVECVQEQQEGIKNCVNSTIGGRFPETSDISVDTLPILLFSEEDCQNFDEIRSCVNVELEKCKDTTPANIVDAFFKFLKKQMPCRVGTEQPNNPNASKVSDSQSSASNFVSSVLVTLGLLLLIKNY